MDEENKYIESEVDVQHLCGVIDANGSNDPWRVLCRKIIPSANLDQCTQVPNLTEIRNMIKSSSRVIAVEMRTKAERKGEDTWLGVGKSRQSWYHEGELSDNQVQNLTSIIWERA